METIRVVTLCSGYDAQCLALRRLEEHIGGFHYELVRWAEIDKFASKAHDALFPEWAGRNLGDITKCDWAEVPRPIDLLTYSTPCQSISLAGKMEGLKKGSGTESSIIWSVLDAIDTLKPKYLLMENVKALVSKRFIADFWEWRHELSVRGYKNSWAVLNAKDFGVPQNRERVFMVSVLGGKDDFVFPEGRTLRKGLEDVLEKDVDESYYLPARITGDFSKLKEENRIKGCVFKYPPIPKVEWSLYRFKTGKWPYEVRDVMEPMVCAMRGRPHGDTNIQQIEVRPGGIMNAITTVGKDSMILNLVDGSVRRLTPREVFRLMDLSEEDIDRIQVAGISKTQQYKMAGNSIVVSCLYEVLYKMLISWRKPVMISEFPVKVYY